MLNENVRITPACAGKTGIQSYGLIKCQDHPRVCGENYFFLPFTKQHKGSPPRVRGKLDLRMLFRYYDRITPACAGKTWKRRTLYKFH